MIKPHLLLVLILLIGVSFTAKQNPISIEKEIVCGIWKRYKIEQSFENEYHEEMFNKYPPKEEKEYYIVLFQDGRGVLMWRTEIDTINWAFDKKTEKDGILIQNLNSSLHKQFDISLNIVDTDTTLQVITSKGFRKMFFKKEAAMNINYEEDPYYPDNNIWRIRAQRNISETEIKLKVINYLTHYKFLFKSALRVNNKMKFTNKYSRGILQIYKSKIDLVDRDKIGEDWYSLFYDEKEALKAYDYLKTMISQNKVKIRPTQNWIKDNYGIIQNILNNERK